MTAEWWRPIWYATADVAELLPAGVASQWMTKYHGLVDSDDLLEVLTDNVSEEGIAGLTFYLDR